MKRYLLIPMLLVALLLTSCTPKVAPVTDVTPTPGATISIRMPGSGQEVFLTVGDTLVVTNEGSPQNGWSENATIGNKRVLQQEDHSFKMYSTPVPFYGGSQTWTLKALTPGNTTVSWSFHENYNRITGQITINVIVK